MPEDTTITTLEDALEALKNARTDAARQRTKAKEASDKLTAAEEQLAAYTELGTAEDLGNQLEAFEAVLEGMEGAGVKIDDPEAVTSFLGELPARLERAKTADALEHTVTLSKAATATGVAQADLDEWLAGRPLTIKKVKQEDGNETDAYGLQVGEEFKPLDGFSTFTRLKTEAPPVIPPPRSAPTGQVGAPAKPLTDAEFLERKRNQADASF